MLVALDPEKLEDLTKKINANLIELFESGQSRAEDVSSVHLYYSAIKILVQEVVSGLLSEAGDLQLSNEIRVEALRSYFKSPVLKVLPFPGYDLSANPRFTGVESGGSDVYELFYCYGRPQRFIELESMMKTRLYKIGGGTSEKFEIFGNIGSGKSHLLAMYIVFLHTVRLVDPSLSFCVPVYIDHCSTCLKPRAQKWSLGLRLKSAVELAAGNPGEYQDPVQVLLRGLIENHDKLTIIRASDTICEQFVDELNEVCSEALALVPKTRKQGGFNIVFFIDDWNAVDKANAKTDQQNEVQLYWLQQLGNLMCRQRGVVSISAGCGQKAARRSADSTDNINNDEFLVYGGLNALEWSVIRTQPSIARVYDRLSRSQQLQFDDLTGLVPLFVTRLCTLIVENDLNSDWDVFTGFPREVAHDITEDDAVSASDVQPRPVDWTGVISTYYEDEKVRGVSGGWILAHLNNFIDETVARKVQAGTHERAEVLKDIVKLFKEGSTSTCIAEDLYDHRYFYRVKKFVKPISGFVRTIFDDILKKVCIDSVMNNLIIEHKWYQHVAKTGNPSERGFALEAFFIACFDDASFVGSLLNELPPAVTELVKQGKVRIVRFEQNFPVRCELNANALTLFVPFKWNLRAVDAVLRVVVGNTTYIFAMQVTMQTPVEHRSSIDFYIRPYKADDVHHGVGICDFSRYETEAESENTTDPEKTVEHHLFWILLHDRNKIGVEEIVIPSVPKQHTTRSAKKPISYKRKLDFNQHVFEFEVGEAPGSHALHQNKRAKYESL
jgi:hypothetical protein